MKKHLILSLLIAFSGSLFNCIASEPEEPRRDDGRINTFVIFNAQLTPELAEQFNFIMVSDFSLTSQPDSYYSAGILPGNTGLIASDKALVKALFSKAKAFEVNGKPVSEAEFYAVPGQMLASVKYEGGVLKARTRDSVHDPNIYRDLAYKESEIWYYENALTPMPADVALNDPETYFLDPNTIVTLDYIITSPVNVKKSQADVKGYALRMVGANPQVYALTNAHDLEYFGYNSEHLKTEVSAIGGPLTVANVAAYFKRPIEDLLLIKTDGKTIDVFLREL
ncbi:MAG: hypothetical protein K2K82_01090 [Muribaculaceae bacterium]|nr:hypothetical protein [Muribaculaceae bacterium]